MGTRKGARITTDGSGTAARDSVGMKRRIVVGYDGGAESQDALALAHRLAQLTDADLLIAYVERVGPYTFPPPSAFEAIRERAEQRVNEVVEKLRSDGVGADPRPVVVGSPAQGLNDLCEREAPEFVVVGSSHHGRVGAVALGTVGVRLLHGSPCPVAMAPRGFADQTDWAPRRIGVGYDGSSEAHAALRCATSLAVDAGTSVHVVVAAEPLSPYVEVLSESDANWVREQAQERLREGLTEVGGDVSRHGEIVNDAARTALEAASRELDVLVVGSRGNGPFRRVLLGSVSSHLAHASACPLIVTPRASVKAAEGVAEAEPLGEGATR